MSKVWSAMQDPVWIVTVVVFGLIVAVIAIYIQRILDKFFEKAIGYVSNRSAKTRKRKAALVAHYQAHPDRYPLLVGRLLTVQFGVLLLLAIFTGTSLFGLHLPRLENSQLLAFSPDALFRWGLLIVNALEGIAALVGMSTITLIVNVMRDLDRLP